MTDKLKELEQHISELRARAQRKEKEDGNRRLDNPDNCAGSDSGVPSALVGSGSEVTEGETAAAGERCTCDDVLRTPDWTCPVHVAPQSPKQDDPATITASDSMRGVSFVSSAPKRDEIGELVAEAGRTCDCRVDKTYRTCFKCRAATALQQQSEELERLRSQYYALSSWAELNVKDERCLDFIRRNIAAALQTQRGTMSKIYVEAHDYSPSIFLACKVGNVVTEIELVGTNKHNGLGGQLAQWLWDIEAHEKLQPREKS